MHYTLVMSWAGDRRELRPGFKDTGFKDTGYWMVKSNVHSGVIDVINVVESVFVQTR